MSKEECKLCKMDFITKYGYRWYPNGTWGKKDGLLLAFLGREEILNIFESIEKELQQPLNKLISLAKRIITLNVVDQEFLGHLMRILIRARIINKGLLKNALNKKFISPIGWGVCEKVDINHGRKSALFLMKNYPSVPLIEGAVAGLVQYIFKLQAVNVKSKEKNNLVEILISPAKQELEIAKYILKPVPSFELGLLPGNIKYHECPKCKTPYEFSKRYEWNIQEGKIFDKETKKDQLLFTRYAIEAIFGILKRELGEEVISNIIFRSEREYIKKLFRTKKDSCEKFLNQKYFGVKGWGNIKKIEKNNNKVTVIIENPLYEEILAGFVVGCYEASFGGVFENIWYKKEKLLQIVVKTK